MESSVERSSLYIVNRKGRAKSDNLRAKFLLGCGVALEEWPQCRLFRLSRDSFQSNKSLARMKDTRAPAAKRSRRTEYGIVPPPAGRVACGLLRCHYERSARVLRWITNLDYEQRSGGAGVGCGSVETTAPLLSQPIYH